MNTNRIEDLRRESTGPDAISAITVGGFKSIRDEIEIEIRPLTILAGANSSGKSSAMQPLLLLKQTLEDGYDPGPLLLDGHNISFPSADKIFSRPWREGSPPIFWVALKTRILHGRCRVRFQRSTESPGVDIHDMTYEMPFLNLRVTLRPSMTSEELAELFSNFPEEVEEVGPSANIRVPSRWVVTRDRSFLEIGAMAEYELSSQRGEVLVPTRLLSIPKEVFWKAISGILHVPGNRGEPLRAYRYTPPAARLTGKFEGYVAGLLAQWQDHKPHKTSKLREWLAKLHLGSDIKAKVIGQTMVELKINLGGAQGREEWFDLADVGLGVSQTLPLLVALLQAMERPGTTVYVEQPEMHLHPRAQVAMAEILAEAAQEGVCVIAETHSSLLLLGIQTIVASRKLDPGYVKLHWFKRGDDGATEVSSADLDTAGAFGEWDEDFADVELEAQNRYLDAAEQVHFGQ